MLKLRYWFRLILAFLTRFKGLIIIGGIIGIVIFSAVLLITPILAQNKTQRIGITGRYQTNTLPASLQSMLSVGLTKLDDQNIPQPSLADSWELQDEGKTWIFHLKDGYIWHDGTKVTSHTINYEFSDVVVERPDENTIIFKLQEPFIPFPAIVSKPTFKSGLLGVSDWKVSKATVKGNYVQEMLVEHTNGEKKLYRFYPTTESTKLAFKLGQVDTLLELLDPQPFIHWPTANVAQDVNRDQIVTLFFNFGDENSVFNKNNKELRLAAAYAIDKRFWTDERAYSPISPSSWAYNSQVKQYNFDPDRAKELMNELPSELTSQFPVHLVSTPILLPIAEKIASDWNSIGIETTVQVSSIIPTDFHVFLTILDLPSDPDQYALWHTTQTTNIAKYQSPRIDKLLEDGRLTQNTEERKKIYLDFQRFLLEDIPALFLYHPTYYSVTRK